MQTVTTNLRIDEEVYRRNRLIAVEEGMSFNEYVNQILREEPTRRYLASAKKTKKSKTGEDFYEAFEKFIDDPYERKPMGLSEEDKIIYGDNE
ncbi:hypothetical protein A2989_03320 [Candidatus Amesbacteria bacterium RIFCSPLOWO2_01_FULL_48_25]|uniref:Uncharacterized protein n=1 Tax=Candidatus Amesbacteria bacterium RIFCSPLOWO2_01_FULL_48_25 TaxID=1797259 RepID=A0A1F4ZBW2_9BACT|nr:MAG: hypothetical protein A2989_03320 [Candidatus Amesbacteria bacterium RIFCSPLOWO2_01_FULL_48_25]